MFIGTPSIMLMYIGKGEGKKRMGNGGKVGEKDKRRTCVHETDWSRKKGDER